MLDCMENNGKRLEVGIFSPGNLRIGAGVENLIYNLVMSKPENVNITIIQTEYLPYERLEQTRLKEISEKAKLITIKLLLPTQINAIKNLPSTLQFFLYQLYMRVYFNLTYFRRNKKLFSNFDIVYLTNNWFYPIFIGKKLVGTQHTDFDYLPSKSGLKQLIKIRLISAGVLFNRISAFHLFPASRKISNAIKGGNNLILESGVNLLNYTICRKSGKPIFLFVGRLEECKGVKFILELWDKYKIDYELNVVGIGPLYSLKPDDDECQKVNFKGILNERELRELYSRSDILLSPTKCDTYSMTITQALASGCHVLVSDFLNGMFDIYSDAGYLHYLPLKHSLWVKKIEFIATNINEIRKNATMVRQLAAETNDIKKISQKLFTFLENISTQNIS